MVRQVIGVKGYGWKAGLAVAVAGGALLWHVLACVESPMAFSPSGKDLAFVTVEPYDNNVMFVAGESVYRMMILSNRKIVRIVEETSDSMLTAPAYSPDGKRYCYLRIPLPKSGEKGREEGALADPAHKPEGEEIKDVEDVRLPPFQMGETTLLEEMAKLRTGGVLTERNARTDKIVSRTFVKFSLGRSDGEGLMMTYLTTRPQYGPEGTWIYFCAGELAMAVNPSEKKVRILTAPATIASLSPDGKTIALLYQHGLLSFVRTDGRVATYRRLDKKVSLSGLAWSDSRTVALFLDDPDMSVLYIRSDGTTVKSVALKLPEDLKDGGENTGELAIAPNGKYMVVTFPANVFFMKIDGTILKRWRAKKGEPEPKEALAQPTFTPDSKLVAMKYLSEDQGAEGSYMRVTSIVFLTPQGKEVARVAVPRAKLLPKRVDEKPEPAEKPKGEATKEDAEKAVEEAVEEVEEE